MIIKTIRRAVGKVNGSSAVNYDFYENIRLERERKEKELIEKKNRIMKEREKKKSLKRARLVVTVLAVFAIACTVLFRNVSIIRAASSVNALTGELEDLKSMNTKKELSLEESLNLNYVEEVATRKLGMKKADNFQTVYIDVMQNDYAEVAQKSTSNETFHGAYSVIKQGAANVLEYLR